MRPITYIVPDLGHSSHGKQVSLAAPHAKKTGHAVRVFSLAGRGPFAEPLQQNGITVEGPPSVDATKFMHFGEGVEPVPPSPQQSLDGYDFNYHLAGEMKPVRTVRILVPHPRKPGP